MDDTLDAAPQAGDRYLQRTVLGEGGMGQVQQVDDVVLGRAVARRHAQLAFMFVWFCVASFQAAFSGK